MDGFSYHHLRHALKRHRRVIPACVTAMLVLALLWLNLTTPQYSTRMILSPVNKDNVATMGLRLSARKALDATTSGVTENESLSDFARAVQLLTSPEIARQMLRDDTLDIKQHLLATPGIGFSLRRILWRLAGQSLEPTQDAVALSDVLDRDLRIDAIGRSPMRLITLRHADRDFAIAFLNKLYHVTDTHLRLLARKRSQAESAYLQAALENVTLHQQRKIMTQLLAAQQQTAILLAANLPFAAEQLQPAQAPHNPDWPMVGLTLLAAVFLGLFIAVSVLYLLAIRQWLSRSA